MKRIRTARQRGFTLIELVVVLIVIGILAAIAVPRFVDLTAESEDAAIAGVLGGVRAGIALYYAEPPAGNPREFPDDLDGLGVVACGPTNVCFDEATEGVMIACTTEGGWSKCANAAPGPGGVDYYANSETSNYCYGYTNTNGRFSLVADSNCGGCSC